jgi:hypothetical protein
MKKRTRRILFWLAVVMFASASWVAIRYAQGYAYDFSAGQFVRTGAVAVTVSTDATLTVDGRVVGGTSFLSKRVSKDRLLPGTYELGITRDGYSSWRKSALVEEGKLTDFPDVLLLQTDDASLLSLKAEASASLKASVTLAAATPVPSPVPKASPKPTPSVRSGDIVLAGSTLSDLRAASPSVIAEHVLGFSVSDDGGHLLWWTRNEAWVLWMRNTDRQPYRAEGERQLITRFSVPIARAAWFRSPAHVLVDLGNQSYRVVETDARGGTNIIKL